VARLNSGSSADAIKRSLCKNVYSSSDSTSATVIKCRFAAKEGSCFFDATNEAKFLPPKIKPIQAAAMPSDIICHCCRATADSANYSATSTASSAAEEPATQDARVETREELTAASFDEEFKSFRCVSTPNPICVDGDCSNPTPLYRAIKTDYAARSSPCGGGGDAFNVVRVQAFGSLSSEDYDLHYENVAIVDTGANRNHFGERHGFVNRRPVNMSTTLADGSQVRISEQGDFVLHSEDAKGNALEPLILRDVSILKGSPINLVSVSMLCDEGSTFHFEKGNSYFVYKGRKYKLIERHGLYMLRLDDILSAEEISHLREFEKQNGNHCPTEARSNTGVNYACAASWDLWHERFAHTSKKRLKFMFDNGSAEGLAVDGKFTHDSKCKCPTCLLQHNRKLHIGSVRKFADSVTRKGQLIYTDICGPFPPSVEGYRYVISFTDVYSRFSACYMLKKKSDSEAALEALVSFYARNGIIIKEVRSDQGGEYGGHNESSSAAGEGGALRDDKSLDFFFKRVCVKHDIVHRLMPANRPELHGIAERYNLTIWKMANAMLFAARLSYLLWPAAVAHANMLRNRLPVSGLGPYTPYELFYNSRPRVDQLRIFGCDCYKLLPTYPKIPGQVARKRLIYCGETADRVGFRVFDPVTYKFSTEFELIFDEYSARKRINSLYEYDARRDLKNKGKLHMLPLQTDDYASRDTSQEAVRNVFTSPSPSPIAFSESGGDLDEAEPKDGSGGGGALSESTVVESGRSAEHDSPLLASGQPGFPTEHSNVELVSTRASTENRPTTLASGTDNGVTTSTLHDSALRMGGQAASQVPDSDCKHDQVPALIEEASDDEDDPEEFKIHGQSLRPGRLPSLRPRKQQLEHDLSETEAVSVLINDKEAQKFGPLTKEALEAERKKSRLDPRHPRRPLRALPVGQIEKDTPEFKAFRKYAFENNVLIKLVDNPKQEGKSSWRRYNAYQPACSLREIIELSATSKNPAIRSQQAKKAHEDIIFDSLRGYILFPQHEHNGSTHFVDAGRLARNLGTINIHALYSSAEMESARAATLAEAVDVHSKAFAARLADARYREATSIPLNFHDQIKALWEYDAALQLNDSDISKESAFAASLVGDLVTGGIPEPKNFRSVASHPERIQWLESMGRERKTLEDRGTWELVPRSTIGRHRPVKCKYVYKKKLLKDGSIQFKSRLVGCGYSQVEGIDYSADELYAGVCSYSSMRFLMSLVCQKGYILSQADITGAYLESHLTETVYMEPPPDMFGPNGEPPRDSQGRELVCRLKRGIYGLKQSAHLWSKCFRDFLLTDPEYKMEFTQFTGEPNMYRKQFELNGRQEEIILGLYVDDLVIGSSSEEARLWFMQRLESRFPVNAKSTGVISFESPGLVLSMRVRYDQKRGILQIDQQPAIESLARRYGVFDMHPKSMPIAAAVELPKLAVAEIDQNEYLSIVGSCLHIAQVSRPDISYAVGVLSRHSATPGQQHWEAAVNLVNYLYNSRELFIQYTRSAAGNVPEVFEKDWSRRKSIEERLRASKPDSSPYSPDLYIDSDYAGDPNTRRSTSGMVTIMNGGPISWSSRLQKLCAQSSAEAEIYAVTDSVKEAIHIRLLCEEAGIREIGIPIVVWEDNSACIYLGHGLRGSKSAKHFECRLRFLNEQVQGNVIDFAKIDTRDQLADGFTKALPGPAFFDFRAAVLHGPN